MISANDRGHDGTTDTLDRAGADEEGLAIREPTGEGREREEGEAEQKEAPGTEEIAEPAAEQQETAVREQVGVHDPGEGRLREVEIAANRRQSHVHDRDVEHDHQRP